MKLIWQALDNPARTWKLMFKTLTLIQFLIKNGNERVVEECRDHLHQIRPLQDYNYYEGTVDKGSGVRDLSKAVVELLASNDAIRSEREKARQLRHKFTGVGSDGTGSYGNDPYRSGVGYAERGIRSDDFNRSRRDSYKDNSHLGRNREGDAYDSDRRTRSDDNRRGDSEELDYASKMRARREVNKTMPSSPTTGSKFRVNIKGSTLTKVGKSSRQNASDVDLLGTTVVDLLEGNKSMESAPPFTDACTIDNFNGFPTSTDIPPQEMFDAFEDTAAIHTVQQDFMTSFTYQGSTHSMSEQFSQQPQCTQMQQPLQSQIPMQPQMELHSANKPGSQHISLQFEAFPQQTQPQLQMHQSPPSIFQTNQAEDIDFGKFESATPVKPNISENKFASFGGLVDLGGLTSKSVEDAKKQQATMTQASAVGNSFSGLDGFSNSSMGNMNMISAPDGMTARPIMHGGPVMMTHQLYGQQHMSQPQVQNQPVNMLSGQDPGVFQRVYPVIMNNTQQQQQQQLYAMHQSGQSMQRGMNMQQQQQQQQQYPNIGYHN